MSRSDYWLNGFLPMLPTRILIDVLWFVVSTSFARNLAIAVGIACLWPHLALAFKRIHDRNHSGWFLLIFLIPIVGPLWLLIEVWFLKGTVGVNRFGEDSVQCARPITPINQASRDILMVYGIGIVVSGILFALIEVSLKGTHWLQSKNQELSESLAPPQIAMIYIDQESLDQAASKYELSWPWPRETYAYLLSFCKRGGAKTVTINILFTEPSTYGNDDDIAFADAIRAGPPCILPYFSQFGAQSMPVPAGTLVSNVQSWISGIQYSSVPGTCLPTICENAYLLGHIYQKPDNDQVFRKSTLLYRAEGGVYPSLGFATYLAGKPPAEWSGVRIEKQRHALIVGDICFPVDDEMQLTIKFRQNETYPAYSAISILESEQYLHDGLGKLLIDPTVLKDKYVFIGMSAPKLMDLRPTAREKSAPGSLIHARVVDNLLSADKERTRGKTN